MLPRGIKTISPLDGAFLFFERESAPLHVSGLVEFQLPDGPDRKFGSRLKEGMRGDHPVASSRSTAPGRRCPARLPAACR
jgi:hypothetical protein